MKKTVVKKTRIMKKTVTRKKRKPPMQTTFIGDDTEITLQAVTTDGTSAVMSTDGAAPDASNQIIIPDNSVWAIKITSMFYLTADGTKFACRMGKTVFLVRGANAAATELLGTGGGAGINGETAGESAGHAFSSEENTVTADTTLGGLTLTAVPDGVTEDPVTWRAKVRVTRF